MKINFPKLREKTQEMYNQIEVTHSQIYTCFQDRNPDVKINYLDFVTEYVKSFGHN